jgi:hypothetical protein
MTGANTGSPHRRKERIPPGREALAEAAALRIDLVEQTTAPLRSRATTQSGADTTVLYDLSVYECVACGSNTVSRPFRITTGLADRLPHSEGTYFTIAADLAARCHRAAIKGARAT